MSTSPSIEPSESSDGLKSVRRPELLSARDVNLKYLAQCPFEPDGGLGCIPIMAWFKVVNCFEIYRESWP